MVPAAAADGHRTEVRSTYQMGAGGNGTGFWTCAPSTNGACRQRSGGSKGHPGKGESDTAKASRKAACGVRWSVRFLIAEGCVAFGLLYASAPFRRRSRK